MIVISPEGEPFDTNDCPGGIAVEWHALEHGLLFLRRLAYIVVEAIDANVAVLVHERREGVSETPRRVRIMRGATRMGVSRHRSHAEVAIEDALAAERELRPTGAVERSALFQRAVPIGEDRLERKEAGEIRAAGLLLALDEEPHPDR